jgi:hypothetical protein
MVKHCRKEMDAAFGNDLGVVLHHGEALVTGQIRGVLA